MNIEAVTSATAQAHTSKAAPASNTGVMDARCPHGGSPGSCPLCKGAGGGGGGSARKSGLMTWNEAYALWKSLQVAQVRQEDYLKGATTQHEYQQWQAAQAVEKAGVLALLAKIAPGLANFLSRLLQPAAQSGTSAVLAEPIGPMVIVGRIVLRGLERLVDISDKLVAILGDARKVLDDIWHHNVENLKSLLAQLHAGEIMESFKALLDRVFRRLSPSAILQTIGRRVRSIFERIRGWFGGEEEEET